MVRGDDKRDSEAVFTAESAEAVLAEACRSIGLDAADAQLLRLGSNAVYRLATSPVIVRIARDVSVREQMTRAVRVARWLAVEDFPATRALADVEQPLLVGGRVVTFWENAQDREEYARLDELADLLRRLHWLEEPESLRLPYFDPAAKTWLSGASTASPRRTGRSWNSVLPTCSRSTTSWTSFSRSA